MKKKIVVLLCGCMVAVTLAACGNGSADAESSVSINTEEKQESASDEIASQEQEEVVESSTDSQTDSFPEMWIHADIPQYKGLKYQTYKAMTGLEAEPYYAEFYTAYIEKTNVTPHFKATGLDANSEMPILTDEDIAVRLEGSLSTFFAGSYDVMTVDTFIDMISWHGGAETEYQIKEGDGTAYYIANKYLKAHFDSDGDGVNDAVLDVTLDDTEQINRDTVVWLYLDDSQY